MVPSFDGDPAPWDFGAFGRRLADILAAAVRKVGVKRRSKARLTPPLRTRRSQLSPLAQGTAVLAAPLRRSSRSLARSLWPAPSRPG